MEDGPSQKVSITVSKFQQDVGRNDMGSLRNLYATNIQLISEHTFPLIS